MKKLIESNNKVSKATKIKAAAAVILIIIFLVSFNVPLPVPEKVMTAIKVGSVAGLVYILATFKSED